ncbi:MAG: DUF3347 domain-containing protein, partial [Flavobacteriales bacterium]|nr:DUF3347 domain-containing protein [Flavobacteriales bacterium]
YVKLPDLEMPSFEFREVTLGESAGNSYIVLDGVSNGDEVVTNGSFVIDASAQLNNQSSMMNRSLLSDNTSNLPDFTNTTPIKFKDQLNDILINYLSLKNALVNDDAITSVTNAELMMASIEKVEMDLLMGDAHMIWMQQSESLTTLAKEIALEKSIKEQRKTFLELSSVIIDLTKIYGVNEQTYYVQFCPMAFEDGGFWLSSESKILNPYFGEQMLECGSMEVKIDKDFKNKKVVTPINNSPMSGHNH